MAQDFFALQSMAQNPSLEITLETLLESVDLAENIAVRAARAAGFTEEDVHKIGMSVREGSSMRITTGTGRIAARRS